MDFGVYVHVPFCRVQCPYCTFYTVLKPASGAPMQRFLDAVGQEWELRVRPRLQRGDRLRTLYVGGGTPSDLPHAALIDFLRRVGRDLPGGLQALDEVTLECNPESIDSFFLAGLREAGVGRPSLGVQALHDDDLRQLGRSAVLSDVRAALQRVADHFTTWNADLIIGIPGSSEERLLDALEELAGLGTPHLSMYCLELPEVRARKVGDPLNETSDSFKADLYESASAWIEEHGYEHYEISNAALPGHQAQHNRAYWQGREYVGLGPGAHSYEEGSRRANQSGLQRYCDALLAGGLPPSGTEHLSGEKRQAERLLLGLRQRRGIEVTPGDLAAHGGFLEELVAQGLAHLQEGRLQLTTRGWLVSDSIVLQLVAG